MAWYTEQKQGERPRNKNEKVRRKSKHESDRTLEQLNRDRELLQIQIDRMPIGCITWDTEFRVQTWNPAAEKIFGFTSEEAIGKHPYDLIVSEELRPHVDEVWHKLLKGDMTAHSINENTTRDGRIIICDWSNTPLKKNNGTVVGVLSMVQDVTERKQTEEALKKSHEELEMRVRERTAELEEINEKLQAGIDERKRAEGALRESEERFVQFMQHLPGAAWIKNVKGHYVYANPVAEKIFRKALSDLLGKTDDEIFPADTAEQFKENDRLVVTRGRGLQTVETLPQEDGIHHSIVSKFPILDRNGALVLVGGVAIDITERKKAEEQIKASLREKEILLKEIHHRVKNNLQIISSLLNLQSKYIETEEIREKFKESQNRVKSMALIHEKLYQSGSLVGIGFSDYIKSLANYLMRFYGSDKVKLKTEIDDTSLSIDKAIPCGLIVNEIISNSLKHAFPNGKAGEIRISFSSDGDGYTLGISNDGVPFPKDVDFRNTKSLGLQLVCALVDQLKGDIELHTSEVTEFRIKFSP